MPDGTAFVTIARRVEQAGRSVLGVSARFVIVLGLAGDLASQLATMRGLDSVARVTPIGPGCRRCPRPDCPQRAVPATGRALIVNERERMVASLPCAAD
jgi:predicted transcriptional regulator